MDDEILSIVRASVPRRIFGVGVLMILGALLIYLALARPPSDIAWLMLLLVFGAVSVWSSWKMWLATQGWIELTSTQLRTSDGVVLADIAEVQSVNRGILAFKPSNGFMLRTKTKAPRRWQPGLWWCLGRNIGIGGVTNATQTKFMAEMIATMISDR